MLPNFTKWCKTTKNIKSQKNRGHQPSLNKSNEKGPTGIITLTSPPREGV